MNPTALDKIDTFKISDLKIV